MDNTSLKEALQSGEAVLLTNGDGSESEYKCVSAIVYRVRNGKIIVSAEVTDKNGRSVLFCDPQKLRLKE